MRYSLLAPCLLAAATTLAHATTARAQREEQAPRPTAGATTEELGTPITIRIPGEWQMRVQGQSRIPLSPLLGPDPSPDLGQQAFVEHWLRLRPEVDYDEGRLRLIGQIDVLNGLLLADDLVHGIVGLRPRDEYDGYSHVDPRWLYLEWRSPIGLFRAGQMGSSWGLGALANDGDWHRDVPPGGREAFHESEPVFGDYRYGDIVERVAFGTKPFGERSDFVTAIAGDLVFRDHLTDLERGDHAWQGVLAAMYQHGARTIGVYGVYRNQRQHDDSKLEIGAVDLFLRWDTPVPSGGRAWGALEAVAATGSTTFARSLYVPSQRVRQQAVVGQVGVTSRHVDLRIESGWTSGDASLDASDRSASRFVLNPDHRVGLLLFPELLADLTGRAAAQAESRYLVGRPFPGSSVFPTDGGVAGAFYLYPTVVWRPFGPTWDLRLGAVLAHATTPIVDPYRQRAEGQSLNFRGGDPNARDLGLELDAGSHVTVEIARGIALQARMEGAILFPGHAFDDAAGETLDPLVLGRLGLGLLW